MTYIYLIRSIHTPSQTYIGKTQNLRQRLAAHNSSNSPHSAKFAPYHLVSYHAFADSKKAAAFERYLKSGSGRSFANRHLG